MRYKAALLKQMVIFKGHICQKFCLITSFVDKKKTFDADPAFHLNADPDPDPGSFDKKQEFVIQKTNIKN